MRNISALFLSNCSIFEQHKVVSVPNEKSIIFASTSTGVGLSAIHRSNATRIRNRTIRQRIQYSEIRLLAP